MAEQTLLQMTQNILSALNSDEVNSISDTTESLQIANIIQNKYYDIQARAGLPEHSELLQLNPSGDPTKPVLMSVPAGVSKIEWIKYFDSNVLDGASLQSSQFGSFSHGLNTDIVNSKAWSTTSTSTATIGLGTQIFTVASSTLPIVAGQGVVCTSGANQMIGTVVGYVGTTLTVNITSTVGSGTFSTWVIQSNFGQLAAPGYIYVTILPLEEFLDLVNRFNPTDQNVASFSFTEGGNNFTFNFKTDHQPRTCTVISNQWVIFDMYDNTQDMTLQGSKTMFYGQIVPPFQLVDSFIPTLTDQQFPLLLNEAKNVAFYELKQMPHALASMEVKRQWNTVAKNKFFKKEPYFDQLANYGRVPRTGGYSGGGYGAYRWMRQAGP